MIKKSTYTRRKYSLLFILMLISPFAFSQIEIKGKVIDSCDSLPLIGAYVHQLKNKEGVVADIDGNFTIQVENRKAVLEVSFVGYKSQKIKVGDRDSLLVVLQEDVSLLDDKIIMVRKPVIYLYPEKETDISVEVDFDGKFSFTYPAYHSGWRVKAKPDGILLNSADNKSYSYLFWDGIINNKAAIQDYKEGFVVHKNDVVDFLQTTLPKFGLISAEYNEFIVYWTPYLLQNEWNLIHFRSGKAYDSISTNRVAPQPDTEIRVFMDFMKLSAPTDIPPQKIITTERKGFTLVEWGGMEVER